MEKDDLTLFSFENSPVRTMVIENEPWFVVKDVCDILGIKNSRDTLAKELDDDEKGVDTIYTLGGEQSVTIVNEPGLYRLIFQSRKPEARQFKRWVFHDVLPAIRKKSLVRLEQEQTEQRKLVKEIMYNVLPGSEISGSKRLYGRYELTSGGRIYVIKAGNNKYELLFYDSCGVLCTRTVTKGLKGVPLAAVIQLRRHPELGKCTRYGGIWGKWMPVEESREMGRPMEALPDDYLTWVEEIRRCEQQALGDKPVHHGLLSNPVKYDKDGEKL
jgi:prophage antirepressor-like protein